MTIYGETLGVVKRENHECIRNEVKTKLHKNKIVVFSNYDVWSMTRFRHELRHCDVIIT